MRLFEGPIQRVLAAHLDYPQLEALRRGDGFEFFRQAAVHLILRVCDHRNGGKLRDGFLQQFQPLARDIEVPKGQPRQVTPRAGQISCQLRTEGHSHGDDWDGAGCGFGRNSSHSAPRDQHFWFTPNGIRH